MSPAYCCGAGKPCPPPGPSNVDAGACGVDCASVCAAVAPNAGKGYGNYCYLTSTNEIAYTCGMCGVGRLPGETRPCPLGETVAERLARQSYYEAVSVVAFEHLAAVLASAGAPAELVARAATAAEDEARHAAIFRDLALAHGATPLPIATREATPSLLELAVENATEGCVRETFGAIVTLHQAENAASDDVRAAYAAIAEDEAEHAAFSWELRAWFDTQLTLAERAEVDRAHRHALEAARSDARERPDAQGLAIGLPAPERAERMLDLVVEAMAA